MTQPTLQPAGGKRRPWLIPLGLLCYAAFVLLCCTRTSPLSVVQDWVDPNVFLTVGRGWFQGRLPYRDLFDQKGPLTYLLYGLCALVDPDGMLGLFGMQVLCLFATLWFAYRTMLRLTGKPHPSLMLALLVPVCTLSQGVYILPDILGGGSTEDILLPMVACSLYALVGHTQPGKRQYQGLFWLLGVLCGCTLMMKFTFAPFFVGLALPLLVELVAHKRWRAALCGLGALVGGTALVAAPFLAYAWATHTLDALVEGYLAFNLLYGINQSQGLLGNLAQGVVNTVTPLWENPLLGLGVIGGLGYFLFFCRALSRAGRVAAVLGYGLLSVVMNSQQSSPQHLIPLSYYCLFGYYGLYALWASRRPAPAPTRLPRAWRGALVGFQALVLLGSTVAGNGMLTSPQYSRLLRQDAMDPAPLAIGRILKEQPEEDQSLLSACGLEMGFYTYSGLVPKSRYFCMHNMTYNQYPALLQGQLADIEAGLSAFVSLWWLPTPPEEGAEEALTQESIARHIGYSVRAGYTLVAQVPGSGYYAQHPIYLYKRNDRWMTRPGDSFRFTADNLLLECGANARRGPGGIAAQGEGMAVTGPHIPLQAGAYEATFTFSQVEALDFGSLYVDVADYGMPLSEEVVEEAGEVTVSFELYEDTQDVELRVYLADGSRLQLEAVTLTLVEPWDGEE